MHVLLFCTILSINYVKAAASQIEPKAIKVSNEIRNKEKIKMDILDTFKESLDCNFSGDEDYIFSLISIPKNQNETIINKFKDISRNKHNDSSLYFTQISDICDGIYQGFDRTIDFLDGFLSFSLTFNENSGMVDTTKFIGHELAFSIIFSSEENEKYPKNENDIESDLDSLSLKKQLSEKFYTKHANDDLDLKNIDFYLITDRKQSLINYKIVRNEVLKNVENCFSSQKKVFTESFFHLLNEYSDFDLENIRHLLNTPEKVFENKDLFIDLEYDYDMIKENVKKLNSEIKIIDSSKSEKRDLTSRKFLISIIYKFFERIEKEEWDIYVNKLKGIYCQDHCSYIILALKQSNVSNFFTEINKIMLEINPLQNKEVGPIFLNYHIKCMKNKKEEFDQIADFKNTISLHSFSKYKEDASMNGVEGILVFLNGESIKLQILDFFDCRTIYDLDKSLRNKNPLSDWDHDWYLILAKSTKQYYFNDYILVLKPESSKYSDINILDWFRSKLSIIKSNSIIKNPRRKHNLIVNHQSGNEFEGYNRFNLCDYILDKSFYKRGEIYLFFIERIKEIIKNNNLRSLSYVTNNSYCFLDLFDLKNDISDIFLVEQEILFGPRKDYVNKPLEGTLLPFRTVPWVVSRIEQYFELESENKEKCKCIFRLDIQNYIEKNPFMSLIFNELELAFIENIKNKEKFDITALKAMHLHIYGNRSNIIHSDMQETLFRQIYNIYFNLESFKKISGSLIDSIIKNLKTIYNFSEYRDINPDDISMLNFVSEKTKESILKKVDEEKFNEMKNSQNALGIVLMLFVEGENIEEISNNTIYQKIRDQVWNENLYIED